MLLRCVRCWAHFNRNSRVWRTKAALGNSQQGVKPLYIPILREDRETFYHLGDEFARVCFTRWRTQRPIRTGNFYTGATKLNAIELQHFSKLSAEVWNRYAGSAQLSVSLAATQTHTSSSCVYRATKKNHWSLFKSEICFHSSDTVISSLSTKFGQSKIPNKITNLKGGEKMCNRLWKLWRKPKVIMIPRSISSLGNIHAGCFICWNCCLPLIKLTWMINEMLQEMWGYSLCHPLQPFA